MWDTLWNVIGHSPGYNRCCSTEGMVRKETHKISTSYTVQTHQIPSPKQIIHEARVP